MRLEEVSPEEAVQLYLEDRKHEVSQTTIYAHKDRLKRFMEWVEDETKMDNMTEMTRQKAHRFKVWRGNDVAPTTLENDMRTFRLFIKFCERFGCCPEGVAKSISVPSAPKSQRSREEKLDPERAEAILDYLDAFEYASFRHVLFTLTWYLGARIGGIRALDVEDFHRSSPNGPYIEFVHRPDTETPLKNGWKSEREPPIEDAVSDLLAAWIDNHRPDVTDHHGREPLVATKQGRPQQTTVRRNIYGMTRPCWIGEDCPEGRDPDDCEATGDYNNASKCPPSRSPHTLRRGRATRNLNDGMPEEMVSDRMDMSPEILREHYNEQTEKDKRKLQRQFLEG